MTRHPAQRLFLALLLLTTVCSVGLCQEAPLAPAQEDAPASATLAKPTALAPPEEPQTPEEPKPPEPTPEPPKKAFLEIVGEKARSLAENENVDIYAFDGTPERPERSNWFPGDLYVVLGYENYPGYLDGHPILPVDLRAYYAQLGFKRLAEAVPGAVAAGERHMGVCVGTTRYGVLVAHAGAKRKGVLSIALARFVFADQEVFFLVPDPEAAPLTERRRMRDTDPSILFKPYAADRPSTEELRAKLSEAGE